MNALCEAIFCFGIVDFLVSILAKTSRPNGTTFFLQALCTLGAQRVETIPGSLLDIRPAEQSAHTHLEAGLSYGWASSPHVSQVHGPQGFPDVGPEHLNWVAVRGPRWHMA